MANGLTAGGGTDSLTFFSAAWDAIAVPSGQLALTFVFGSFGGTIAHFVNNEKRGAVVPDFWFEYPSPMRSALIGAGGAIGFLFFLLAVGGFNQLNAVDYLRLIAVSVIAGFGARSLLPRMVGQLEKQVSAAADAARRASSRADNAMSEAEKVSDENKKLSDQLRKTQEEIDVKSVWYDLVQAGHDKAPQSVWKPALDRADDLMRKGRAPLMIWTNSARVLKRQISLEAAIERLDRGIEGALAGRIDPGSAMADSYHNRACYHELKFLRDHDPNERRLALADVENCLKTAKDVQSALRDIDGEPDLKTLVETSEFLELKRAYPKV